MFFFLYILTLISMPGLLFLLVTSPTCTCIYCLACKIVQVRGQNNFLCNDGIRYPADDWLINFSLYVCVVYVMYNIRFVC